MVKQKNILSSFCFWRLLRFGPLLGILLAASPIQAGVHFTLEGSFADHNLGLRSQDSRAASASISIDLLTYFRLGVTHRQSMNLLEGYTENEATGVVDYTKEETIVHANSIDFTIILYYGQVFVPYIQVGMVKKAFAIASAINDETPVVSQGTTPPVPNGGAGLGIRLNRDFSLKLAYLLSPGIKQTRPGQVPEAVWDTYTSIGISYHI